MTSNEFPAPARHCWRLSMTSALNRRRRLLDGLLCGVVLIACAGCQTFSLSEEDFQKEQRGEMADRETGEVVGVAGSLGVLGAMIGVAASGAARK